MAKTAIHNTLTLLTDFGLQDEYVGVMKGVLLKHCPGVQIVDISHAIAPQNIVQAATMLDASFPYFADGTIHIVVVDPGVGTGRHILLVEAESQFFIGPDNGVLTSLLQSENLTNCYRLHMPDEAVSSTFHGRDIMAPAAAKLCCGGDASQLGQKVSPQDCFTITLPLPVISAETITGEIVAIDHFGNLITSIDAEHLSHSKETLTIEIGNSVIKGISQTYGDVETEKVVAIINSRGKLEIAINGGNAANGLKVKVKEKVIVKKQYPSKPSA